MWSGLKKLLYFHWDKIILVWLTSLYIGILSTLSVLRHNAFASRFDLSNMDQTVYYTLHGHFFQLRDPDDFVSRFSIHADLILVLLSPLYLIWNDVRALIISESVILAMGAIPTYLIARKLLKDKVISLVITTVYLLNPGMQWTDIYEFHGVSFAIPFILFAFYFACIKKWKWYWFFVFLALTTKEQIGLNIAMLGLAVFFVFKERGVGLATSLVGIGWFYSMVYIVMPYFTPAGVHWALKGYGETNPSAILSRFTDISHLYQVFFNKSSIDYYILLVKPFGFLPLLGFPWIALSAPDLAINVIRDTKSITFHYDSGVTPALVIATIFGIYYVKYLLTHLPFIQKYTKSLLYIMAGLLLFISLRVNYHYSPLPTTPSCSCYIYNVTEEDKAFEEVLQKIPANASITASLEVRPHVSHREFAFTVPSATESAQYIALITQNRIISNYEPKEYENQLIPILLSSKKHELRFKSKHFYLFEKVR